MATHRTFIATYIMGSGRNGTLYTGMTANLVTRVWKHKNHAFPGFTDENDCTDLVWFQRHVWMTAAIRREKRIKKWLRDWKLALIERDNPDWLDLAADWYPRNDPDWTPPAEEDCPPPFVILRHAARTRLAGDHPRQVEGVPAHRRKGQ